MTTYNMFASASNRKAVSDFSGLPLFEYANTQAKRDVTARLTPGGSHVRNRFRLPTHTSNLIAELAGIGPKEAH